ncbi:peptide-binding protein [Desulfobaculum senezii]
MNFGRLLMPLLAVVLCCVAACGGDGRDSGDQPGQKTEVEHRAADTASAKRPAQPEQGDLLVTGTIGEPSNLIPPLASDSASHEVADLIYVSLVRYNKDIELEPYAAESYEVLDGGRRLRFTLRQDIRWTDGVELTADDVEFTYKLMIDPKTPTAYSENYKLVKQFTKLDKYTVEIEYEKPFAKALISWAMEILPKHLLEGEDLMDTKYSRHPVGAGPFKFKRWEAGRRIILEANDDYFEGRPHLDGIVYRVIPDISTMFLELKAGNLDMMGLTPQQYLFQTTTSEWEKFYTKFKYLSFGYNFIGWNHRRPMFQDKRVRQALAHAVSKQAMIKAVLFGLGRPTVGPYKPGTWMYNDAITDYDYDPAKAKAMLAEAGWTDSDGDGWLDKDGKPFAFTLLTNQGNEQRIKIATIAQANLKDIGIKVKIRTVEWAAFLKEFLDKGNFDAVVMGWTIPQDPDIFNVWHSSKAVPGGLNFVGYKNPELDELLVQGRHSITNEERKPIYDKVQEILHEEQPYLFLYCPLSLPVVSSRFMDVTPAPAGISHNLKWWWVPEDKQRYTAVP